MNFIATNAGFYINLHGIVSILTLDRIICIPKLLFFEIHKIKSQITMRFKLDYD